jgi:hypothetical protein
MTAILTDAAPLALWTDLVREAEDAVGMRLDEELESYLVFLLIAHTRDVHLHGNAVALDYLLARAQSGTRLREDLRQVGDRCLLLAGLYPEQAEQRMVTVGYFLSLGSHAYDELAAALRAGMAELYERLARAFARLARITLQVRQQMRSVAPLVLHELCTGYTGADRDPQFPGAVLLGGGATRH